MSKENVEIVRHCLEAAKTRDYSALSDLTHPDFVLDLSRNIFNPDTYRGTEGVRLFFERVDEMWEKLEVSPEEIVEAGDRAVTAVRMKGTGRGGIQGEMLVFQVWEFREGKVARISGGLSRSRPGPRCRRATGVGRRRRRCLLLGVVGRGVAWRSSVRHTRHI